MELLLEKPEGGGLLDTLKCAGPSGFQKPNIKSDAVPSDVGRPASGDDDDDAGPETKKQRQRALQIHQADS